MTKFVDLASLLRGEAPEATSVVGDCGIVIEELGNAFYVTDVKNKCTFAVGSEDSSISIEIDYVLTNGYLEISKIRIGDTAKMGTDAYLVAATTVGSKIVVLDAFRFEPQSEVDVGRRIRLPFAGNPLNITLTFFFQLPDGGWVAKPLSTFQQTVQYRYSITAGKYRIDVANGVATVSQADKPVVGVVVEMDTLNSTVSSIELKVAYTDGTSAVLYLTKDKNKITLANVQSIDTGDVVLYIDEVRGVIIGNNMDMHHFPSPIPQDTSATVEVAYTDLNGDGRSLGIAVNLTSSDEVAEIAKALLSQGDLLSYLRLKVGQTVVNYIPYESGTVGSVKDVLPARAVTFTYGGKIGQRKDMVLPGSSVATELASSRSLVYYFYDYTFGSGKPLPVHAEVLSGDAKASSLTLGDDYVASNSYSESWYAFFQTEDGGVQYRPYRAEAYFLVVTESGWEIVGVTNAVKGDSGWEEQDPTVADVLTAANVQFPDTLTNKDTPVLTFSLDENAQTQTLTVDGEAYTVKEGTGVYVAKPMVVMDIVSGSTQMYAVVYPIAVFVDAQNPNDGSVKTFRLDISYDLKSLLRPASTSDKGTVLLPSSGSLGLGSFDLPLKVFDIVAVSDKIEYANENLSGKYVLVFTPLPVASHGPFYVSAELESAVPKPSVDLSGMKIVPDPSYPSYGGFLVEVEVGDSSFSFITTDGDLTDMFKRLASLAVLHPLYSATLKVTPLPLGPLNQPSVLATDNAKTSVSFSLPKFGDAFSDTSVVAERNSSQLDAVAVVESLHTDAGGKPCAVGTKALDFTGVTQVNLSVTDIAGSLALNSDGACKLPDGYRPDGFTVSLALDVGGSQVKYAVFPYPLYALSTDAYFTEACRSGEPVGSANNGIFERYFICQSSVPQVAATEVPVPTVSVTQTLVSISYSEGVAKITKAYKVGVSNGEITIKEVDVNGISFAPPEPGLWLVQFMFAHPSLPREVYGVVVLAAKGYLVKDEGGVIRVEAGGASVDVSVGTSSAVAAVVPVYASACSVRTASPSTALPFAYAECLVTGEAVKIEINVDANTIVYSSEKINASSVSKAVAIAGTVGLVAGSAFGVLK